MSICLGDWSLHGPGGNCYNNSIGYSATATKLVSCHQCITDCKLVIVCKIGDNIITCVITIGDHRKILNKKSYAITAATTTGNGSDTEAGFSDKYQNKM